MNSLIKPFDFKGTPVRTITYETGLTWWVLKDVCDALDLSNPSKVAARLDDDEIAKFDLGPNSELGRGLNTEANIVNEAGLYKIILRSDKPEAKEFQRWVTHEVLPSIRRHGGYMAGQESMTPEQMALASMRWLNSKVEEQKAQLVAQAPKVLFADSVAASNSNILIGEMAKILRQNGVENMGANRFFQWLRQNGYLISRNGRDYNMPTQRSMELKLFFVKETTITHSSGYTTVSKTPLVTPKGQIYLTNKFLGANAIKRLELAK
ncbi:phage antirepressor [Bifidobacterium mongoliense]|uniref:Phage antirepressor protein n=1 Tax=Bifidobacterium mongoliense DSM 21395 TaxID=1437603 RepID=A0A087BZX2_9BIFI|nr:phage antirepressor KilAC domain-containing protein [Bifidobacterium mongoliense]KFI76572.1 phage antirepressor protein [Bifidobacterium mongoliense DSM 21395]